jgi:hypothetical protein
VLCRFGFISYKHLTADGKERTPTTNKFKNHSKIAWASEFFSLRLCGWSVRFGGKQIAMQQPTVGRNFTAKL